jgi:uncharacterized protein YdaT
MSKSTKGNNQHVVPYDDKFAVRSAGAKKVTRVTETQKESIEIAKEIAKNQGSEVIIHGKDGKIRQKNSYGNDPYPPAG